MLACMHARVLCTYVCVCVCVRVCVRACVRVRACSCVGAFGRTGARMCGRMSARVSECVRVCVPDCGRRCVCMSRRWSARDGVRTRSHTM